MHIATEIKLDVAGIGSSYDNFYLDACSHDLPLPAPPVEGDLPIRITKKLSELHLSMEQGTFNAPQPTFFTNGSSFKSGMKSPVLSEDYFLLERAPHSKALYRQSFEWRQDGLVVCRREAVARRDGANLRPCVVGATPRGPGLGAACTTFALPRSLRRRGRRSSRSCSVPRRMPSSRDASARG